MSPAVTGVGVHAIDKADTCVHVTDSMGLHHDQACRQSCIDLKPGLAMQVEIDRLNSAAESVRLLCTDDVRTGIYWVRCATFKELLASAAEGLAAKLLDFVRNSARSSNNKVSEQYQASGCEHGIKWCSRYMWWLPGQTLCFSNCTS